MHSTNSNVLGLPCSLELLCDVEFVEFVFLAWHESLQQGRLSFCSKCQLFVDTCRLV